MKSKLYLFLIALVATSCQSRTALGKEFDKGKNAPF